ncbi:hypothetical protein [uncultured Dokdonia sp.]|uniref:hypothetical protein n=1 Tax=unclassified Dokdonia TaxID=2615033 RepID=UPI0026069013|nr:hypothetical protein [uncultured Dokdonia sp.]
MKYSIPEKRELTKYEIEFLTYLCEKEKKEWLTQIKGLKVIARCGCGICPTILLGNSINLEVQSNKKLWIDYYAEDDNGNPIGISIFGTEEMPTELEFFSLDGNADVKKIPKIETLKSNGN